MDGKFFIPAPPGKKLRNLQIVFLKDASQDFSLRNEQLSEEIDFLNNQFVMIKEKIYQEKGGHQDGDPPTCIWIYNVSNPQKMFEGPENVFFGMQCGFFLRTEPVGHSSSTFHNCNFVLMCTKNQYLIQFKPDDTYEIKEESSQQFYRCNQHMLLL